MFPGGMTELGEIYSCSQILCWTTSCRPYHSAVRITRFALTCTVFVTATEVTKIQGTISITSNSPKVPLQRQRVTTAGQSLQTNTERAAQHTAGAKLCKPSRLHGFPLWKSEWTKTSGTEFKAPPGRGGCWQCPPILYVRTPWSRHTLTTRHDTRMRAHTVPAQGGQGTDCFCHFSDMTPVENTKATDCTSIEGQHSHLSLYLTLWTWWIDEKGYPAFWLVQISQTEDC